jgi:peptide/nickel transport system permease protein
MLRFMLSRMIQGVVTLFIISLIVFGLVRLTGNPLDMMLPADAGPEMREQVSKSMGLDRPLPVQYGIFLSSLLRGDLGTSIRSSEPVTHMIFERIPNTLELAAAAMGIALILALPLGVLAATHKGRGWDTLARGVSLLGQSIPTFWAGIVLIQIFSVTLGWLPAGRQGGLEHLVLPAVTLGLFGFMLAGVTRILRGSMIETLDSDYVLFARIKGVGPRAIAWRHGLSNALIPVVTFVGFYFGIMVSGTVVVETVFAWPGLGRLAFDAVQWRDYPVVQGVVLMVAVITLLTNLGVDVLYAYLDPRIRYS